MAKFFNFNSGTRVCVDAMQVRYIRPVIDTDLGCSSMYSDEEFTDITEKKPAGISRILVVSEGGERVYEEHVIIAYEVTVIFQGTREDKIYLRVDEYERFLEAVIGEDSKDTDNTYDDLGPLPQAIFDSAPEWAKYAAMDDNGSIYFYEAEPKLYEAGYIWESRNGSRQERYWPHTEWKKSLTKRSK